MVDWGILAFFVVQLAITFAVYHAWNGVKAEKSVLLAETARIREVTVRFDALSTRMDGLEKTPGERVARVQALEDNEVKHTKSLLALKASLDNLETKYNSMLGRIAANAKAAKRVARMEDEEQDPDAQAEDGEQAQAPQLPGSFPRLAGQTQAPGMNSGFGVLKRSGSHG